MHKEHCALYAKPRGEGLASHPMTVNYGGKTDLLNSRLSQLLLELHSNGFSDKLI